MSYENIEFRKSNMTFDGSYFYMMDDNWDELVQKLDDGSIAFSYPLNSILDSPVISLEFDGVDFWTLQSIEYGIDIKRWRIENELVELKETFIFKPNFDSEAFSVEHYNTFLDENVLAGSNEIKIKDDYLSKITNNLRIHIGPNIYGEHEDAVVSGVSGTSIVLASGVLYNYNEGDKVDFSTHLWIFNNYGGGNLYKHPLNEFVPQTTAHWDGDHAAKTGLWEYIIAEGIGTRTNYHMKFIVNCSSGVDNNNIVYLNNNCNSDFSDLRFTTDDGETLMDYWIEDKVDNDHADVWVKIPKIFAYPNITNIYVYYDNSTASGYSNPQTTFDLLEDKISYVKYSGYSGHPSDHQGLINNFNYSSVLDRQLRTDIYIQRKNTESYVNYFFTCFMNVTLSGVWEFAIDGDDAVEVEIDGNVIAHYYGSHGFCNCYDHNGSIDLNTGWHKLIVRHEEDTGREGVILYFKAPGDSDWQPFTISNLQNKAKVYAKQPDFGTCATYDFIVNGLPIKYALTKPTNGDWGMEETVASGNSMSDWTYRKRHTINNSVADNFLEAGIYKVQFDAYDNDTVGEISIRFQNENEIIDAKATNTGNDAWVSQEDLIVISGSGNYYDVKGRQLKDNTYIWGADNVTLTRIGDYGASYNSSDYANVTACTFGKIYGITSYPINSLAYEKDGNLKFINVDTVNLYASMLLDNFKPPSTYIKIYDLAIVKSNIYRLQKEARYYGINYSWNNYNYVLSTSRRFIDTVSISAYPLILPANGVNVSKITMIVNDQYGDGSVNKPVFFKDTDDVGFLTINPAYTDIFFGTGKAVSYYKAGVDVNTVNIEGTATQYD